VSRSGGGHGSAVHVRCSYGRMLANVVIEAWMGWVEVCVQLTSLLEIPKVLTLLALLVQKYCCKEVCVQLTSLLEIPNVLSLLFY
jgi:hypothetical protein